MLLARGPWRARGVVRALRIRLQEYPPWRANSIKQNRGNNAPGCARDGRDRPGRATTPACNGRVQHRREKAGYGHPGRSPARPRAGSVTDTAGRIVHGLSRENFILFDDNVPQPITSLSVVESPAVIGLVFDLSGSMRDKVDRARRAAQAFWATTNSEEEVFLVTFVDRAELGNDVTSDFGDIQQRLLFAPARGKTP